MPQLATETFFTQYFWLMLFFFGFNYFMLNYLIPSIASNIKARKVTSIVSDINFSNNSSNINVNLPESILTSSKEVSFVSVRSSWINSIKNSK